MYESDAQFFAPVDLDFDGLPIGKPAGYFFGFEKSYWAATGERTHVGNGQGNDASMNGYRRFSEGGEIIPNPDPDGEDDFIFIPGTIIDLAPPVLLGNINDAGVSAEFGWGERYELGYTNEENGWLIGILDGPDVNSGGDFGFGLSGQDGTVGGDFPSRIPGRPDLLASPLGSVIINFDDPLGLMLGYLDVEHGLIIGGTPGGQLEADTNGDGILDGDGFADDVNRNGQFGPDGIDTETPGEVPDRLGGGLPHDFGDLVFLPTSWQFVSIRNSTDITGVEFMRTHKLNNEYMMKKNQNNQLALSYGVRFLQLDDGFNVDADGGVLGFSFWHTQVTNNLVGPQFQLDWNHRRNRVGLDLSGRCMLAYNIQNFDQTAALGEDLVLGQHNHPLWFPASYTTHGKTENDFSPAVELRAQGSYQLTRSIALKLGYTAVYIDSISRASAQVKYELPQMGFRDNTDGDQEILMNGFDTGFELVY